MMTIQHCLSRKGKSRYGSTPKAPGNGFAVMQLVLGLANECIRMLRHTMATTLLANGCPIGHIRELLGHTQLATTCRYYLGRMSEKEVKAAHGRYLSYKVTEGEETETISGQGQKTLQ